MSMPRACVDVAGALRLLMRAVACTCFPPDAAMRGERGLLAHPGLWLRGALLTGADTATFSHAGASTQGPL